MTSTAFLVFDAYGTLLKLDDFYERLRRGFAAQGVHPEPAALKLAMHREMNHYIDGACRAADEKSWLLLRRECADILMQTLREQGCDLALDPETALHILGDAVVFQAFDDVVETIGELEDRGIPMGVASNWDYQLASVLAEHELADYFHFALPSALIGCEKPSSRFFELVRRRVLALHPSTETIYYIGDHYEKDVIPSRDAAFIPLWLIHDFRDTASGHTQHPDTAITRLTTLTELLPLFPQLPSP